MKINDKINNFLSMMERRTDGLKSRFIYQNALWEVYYKVHSPQCIMYLEYNDSYLYIQTDFALSRIAKGCFLPLYFYLLNLNDTLSIVKFGLSEATNVTLTAELPLDSLNYPIFQHTIKMTANVFWLYRPEIHLISTDSELGKFVMPNSYSRDLTPIKILNANQAE